MKENLIAGSGSMAIISESEKLDYREVVYVYYQDPYKDGRYTLNIDYSMESDSGDSLNGTCITDLTEVLDVFEKQNFDELKAFLIEYYKDNEDAWNTIIEDFKSKGLKLVFDESN